MTKPIVAICYPAPVDSTLLEQRRGPELLVRELPNHVIVDMRDRTPGDLSPAELDQLAEVTVAFILDVPDWLIEHCPKLAWIHSLKTGYDHIDLNQLHQREIRLTNGAGTAATEIAEFVIARVLEHWKHLPKIAEQQQRHEWRPRFGRALSNAHVVLVGYGPINQEVARLLSPFGTRLTAVRRSAGTPSLGVERVVSLDNLGQALATADIVVAALPSTSSTVGMFDAATFASMKPGAFFVNVGRGSAVVESDLVASLESGHLGGAAIDVTETEPLPENDSLWDSAVRISPHCSASLDNIMRRVHELFVRNVSLFESGKAMENEVDVASERLN